MEHKIELLKNSRLYKGKRYDNLYLRIDNGNPVAITLAPTAGKFNFKLKNFLLAMATDCEIRQVTQVRIVENAIADDDDVDAPVQPCTFVPQEK